MSGHNNKIFDDIAKITGSVISSFANIKSDIKSYIDNKIELYVSSKQFIKKEDFEILQELLKKTREEQIVLKKKIVSLEKKIK